MIKKIISIVFVLLVSVCLVTGCEEKKENSTDNTSNGKIKSVEDITSKSGTLNCTREATVEGGTGKFTYIIKYKGDNLTSIYSEESITSEDSAVLKEYEDAYNNIDSNYEGIDNYICTVKKTGDTVVHVIDIDYEKVDIKKIVEIEGEEDNIFENNKPKLSKYFELIKKMGITCSESTI